MHPLVELEETRFDVAPGDRYVLCSDGFSNMVGPGQMLAVFDQFIAALKTNPNLQIAVQKRPFDIEPGKTLKNEDTSVEDRKPRSFSLQITRRIGS